MKQLYWLFCLLFTTQLSAQKTFLQGFVYDSLSGEKLEYVQICLEGELEVTLSNRDGRFFIEVPADRKGKLSISLPGYYSKSFLLQKVNFNHPVLKVPLRAIPTAVTTNEAIEIKSIMRKVIDQLEDNYLNPKPYIVKGWYGESARLFENRKALSFAEGEIEVAKNHGVSLNGGKYNGFVRIIKAQKKALPEFYMSNGSTFAVPRFIQGCFLPLAADLSSSPDFTFTKALLQHYFFEWAGQDSTQGRKVIIIGFRPIAGEARALFEGKFYVDSEKFAIVKATYSLSPKTLALMNKKLEDLNFVSRQTVVSYQEFQGRWYLQNAFLRQLILDKNSQQLIEVHMNYARSAIEFKSWGMDEFEQALGPNADFIHLAKPTPYDPKRGFYEPENKGRTKL
jgi:hypothetical protein